MGAASGGIPTARAGHTHVEATSGPQSSSSAGALRRHRRAREGRGLGAPRHPAPPPDGLPRPPPLAANPC